MHKIFLLLSILLTLPLSALPLGNPSDPTLFCQGLIGWQPPCPLDALSLRIGFYGDYVFNRYVTFLFDQATGKTKELDHTQIFTNAGFIALNIANRMDFFGTLGGSKINVFTSAKIVQPQETAGNWENFETNTSLSWSAGARLILFEYGCTTLGIEGQYFYTNPNLSRFTMADLVSLYRENVDATYREWQVGLGLSHRIKSLVPYVGAKWSKLQWAILQPVDPRFFKNNKRYGFAIGTTYIPCDIVDISVEGRFGDEKALHVNGQIRF